MGGEDKEENSAKPLLKPGKGKGVFDVAISKLLKDFTSAELLSQTPETSSSTINPNQDTKYDCVVSSLKCLHLRRPIPAKQRKMCVLKKKRLSNSLNLAVAASHFQKPIVWPAKLSGGHCKKTQSHLLYPPRLDINKNLLPGSSSVIAPKGSKSESKPTNVMCENEHAIFGCSSSELSMLSFSNLCEKNDLEQSSVVDLKNLETSSTNDSSSSTSSLAKRHSTGADPPAKFAKTVKGADKSGSVEYTFSDYRRTLPRKSSVHHCHRSPTKFSSWKTAGQSSGGASAEPVTASSEVETSSNLPLLPHSIQNTPLEGSSINRSCSLEMRMEETNVNELASYFEDLLHIPRKMSTMAEMMYA
ncbi:unnamed protein product [Lymnaea stagnalis]|uniref:Oxidative stress-responsive serine-rich protein 1 n=1 Tax=Lymnaea stagnalis TaxID=6523 RepID=A0AAV2IBV5_LYMST